jgi:hypothetical protein
MNQKDINKTESYKETFFHVSGWLHLNDTNPIVKERQEKQGWNGVYFLADELTAEFEKINESNNWYEGDYLMELDSFITNKLK